MKRVTLVVLYCCMLLSASAQYYINRNNIWTFGNAAGLDFTSGTPTSFTSSINTSEGCASICNAAGSLLFYTDGRTVYNRLGAVMPGGSAITSFFTGSSTQGALIVPVINDPDKYYVFSSEMYPTTIGSLAYSIVDMTLAGGFGDISGTSGILIDTGMSEKMIAIPGDACNVWLLTHRKNTPKFYAYEITVSGISSTPVISTIGTFTTPNCYEVGVMKCSPDRQKLGVVAYPLGSMYGLELFDFNPATGIVSNCRMLESSPTSGSFYGAEFSPDNSKLYALNTTVYQWDVTLPTTAAIVASKTAVSASGGTGDLKTGPDGKIYVARYGLTTLDCINTPNLAGAACGYLAGAVSIAPNAVRFGLPNLVWNTTSVAGPGTICVGTTTTYSAPFGGGTWTSSNPAVATISSAGVVSAVAAGTTVISYVAGTSCDGTKTVNVVAAPTLSSPGICVGSSTALTASTGAGTWTSGSTSIATVGSASGIVTGVATGTVVITYSTPGCPATTTVVTVDVLSITGSSTVCLGSTLTLGSTVTGGTWTSSSPFIASVGSSTGVLTGVALGTALITYSAGSCSDTAIATVSSIVISGAGPVCAGATITLTSSMSGGTWSSGSTSTATVGSSTGVVTGMTPGTVLITYSGSCTGTATVTVNPGAPPTGGSVCSGNTLTLTGSISGGTWSSSNPSVASVGLTSGVVSGLTSGTASITYLNPTSCMEITIVTVNTNPGPISGKFSLCETFSTMVYCTPAGGSWSSGSPNATITTSGLVTGITPGTATITYMTAAGCFSTAVFSVNPLPGAISGPTTVVAGSSITLSNPTPGGSWTSSDSARARPDVAGVITGMAPGTATIYYVLPTGCKQSVVVTVNSKNTTGVGSVKIVKPALYPNPATNEITVTAEPSAFTSFSIYNVVGQLVTTHEIINPQTTISVKAYPPGEYQVIFKGNSAREVIRFTKW